MGSLIGAGVARDLEDAYQQAIWADAELRGQLTKAQQERAQRAAADQHRAAVNRARTQRPASRPATPRTRRPCRPSSSSSIVVGAGPRLIVPPRAAFWSRRPRSPGR
jgi:hypothetical protein